MITHEGVVKSLEGKGWVVNESVEASDTYIAFHLHKPHSIVWLNILGEVENFLIAYPTSSKSAFVGTLNKAIEGFAVPDQS